MTEYKTIGPYDHIEGEDLSFDYGTICVEDYTNINHIVKTTYITCIRLGIVEKTINFAGDRITEIQFIYRDNDNKTHCAKIPHKSNYHIEVLKKGDMQIEL